MEDAVERVLARRRRQRRGRLPAAGLAGAVLLHAALATAAVVVPRLGEADRQEIEYVAVQIVPAQALGRPRPPAPEPEPAPAPPEPEPEPEEPEPEPEPEPDPDLPTLPSPEPEREEPRPEPEPRRPAPEPEPRQPEPRATGPGPTGGRQGSPQGSPTGTSALGARVATLGDPDFTYGYYLDRILAAIEANWRRPPTDAPIEVTLDFRIRRDGTVSDLDVHQTSGLNSFDLAGLRAVQAASPLPPLPAGYRKDSLAVRLVIR